MHLVKIQSIKSNGYHHHVHQTERVLRSSASIFMSAYCYHVPGGQPTPADAYHCRFLLHILYHFSRDNPSTCASSLAGCGSQHVRTTRYTRARTPKSNTLVHIMRGAPKRTGERRRRAPHTQKTARTHLRHPFINDSKRSRVAAESTACWFGSGAV